MKTSDLLQQVHDLLEPNGAWGQAAPARDAKGNVLASTSKLAVCWCLIGAVQNVCYKNETTCYLVDKAHGGLVVVKEVDDVYADMLRSIFESTTGMYLSL